MHSYEGLMLRRKLSAHYAHSRSGDADSRVKIMDVRFQGLQGLACCNLFGKGILRCKEHHPLAKQIDITLDLTRTWKHWSVSFEHCLDDSLLDPQAF